MEELNLKGNQHYKLIIKTNYNELITGICLLPGREEGKVEGF